MKNLFLTDLDGTALGGNYPVYERFPEVFADFLDSLAAKGWQWGINTSWNLEAQMELIADSPLKSRPAYIISEFGRKIARVKGDTFELLQPYCDQMDEKIAEYTDAHLAPLLEELNRNFIPDIIQAYGHLFSYWSLRSKTGITMTEFIEKHKNNPAITVSGNQANKISVLPSFLGKGVALEEIMRADGYEPENVWTAGDQIPDISMMKIGAKGRCVCPANAAEELKEFVRSYDGYISELEFGAGVADAMNKLIAEN